MRGWLLASRLDGDPGAIRAVVTGPQHDFQSPDATGRLEPGTRTLHGAAGQLRLSAVGGRARWGLAAEAISPGYDVNEVGFQHGADWLLLTGWFRYERFTSGPLVRHWIAGTGDDGQGSGGTGLGWTWAGRPRARTLSGFLRADTTGYWTVAADWAHDFEAWSIGWLRGGPALLAPSRDTLRVSVVSDQRRPSFAQIAGSITREPGSGSRSWMLNPQIDFRSAAHAHAALGVAFQHDSVGWQYVATTEANGAAAWIVARDRQSTVTPTVRAEYTFSPRLALQLYAQPFATRGRYDRYRMLADPRAADPGRRFAPLPGDVSVPAPDAVQRVLNASVVLRWEYGSGSFLTAVWNRRSDVLEPGGPGYGLSRLLHDPSAGVFLIKLTYHIAP